MNFDAHHLVKQINDILEKRYTSSLDHTHSYSQKKPDARQDFADVPSVEDDDEYQTHFAFPTEQVAEAEDEEEKAAEPTEDVPTDIPEEPADAGGEMPADMTGMGGGEDMLGGMGMEEEDEGPQDRTDVGRRFELKKIYSRLVAIEAHLNTASDETLVQMRNFVSQAISLFRVLINNIDLYKDKIDEVLVTYYKFVIQTYEMLSKYYKAKANKEK